MEFLEFNLNDLREVSSGARPTNESKPVITVTPTYNKIDINGNGSSLMNLLPGDRIRFIEHPKFPTQQRWFVVKTDREDGSAKVNNVGGNDKAVIDSTKSFSYAGMWAKLHQSFVGNKEVTMNLSVDELVEQGYMGSEERMNKKNEPKAYVYGKNRIVLELKPVLEAADEDGKQEQVMYQGYPLFNLVLSSVEPYDGREAEGKGAADVDAIDEAETRF